jgi:hypothetical protein
MLTFSISYDFSKLKNPYFKSPTTTGINIEEKKINHEIFYQKKKKINK